MSIRSKYAEHVLFSCTGISILLTLHVNPLFAVFSERECGEFSRLQGWRDLGEGDVKIFLAHLIAMGLVCKGCLEKYWDHGETVKTPFFGTYMGRNTFQSILLNFQVSDGTLDRPCNH